MAKKQATRTITLTISEDVKHRLLTLKDGVGE